MLDLTHDELYKQYLRNSYGPNVFPLIKSLSVFIAFFLIIIIVMLNMSIMINSNQEQKIENIPPPLSESIVIKT